MRARELANRATCANNLRAIGASALAYADDHDGRWMVPPFREESIDNDAVDYQNNTTKMGTPNTGYTPGEVGYQRHFESTTSAGGSGGSTALSTTRALWLLVRSERNSLENFVCPGSTDTVDPTNDIATAYDFTTYANVSYGYQVPFGPPSTRPRTNAHPRQVFVADKGPFYYPGWVEFLDSSGQPVGLDTPPIEWRRFNSTNHGGTGNGEGQNCLFADGTVEFRRHPAIGVDGDNIYTLMRPVGWEGPNRQHGYLPHSNTPPMYPGQDVLGAGSGTQSTTDTLIYP
jgi:hypothetical protein